MQFDIPSSNSRFRQAMTGLALAGAIFAAWLSVHIYTMFVFDLTWTTLPSAVLMAVLQCWLSVGLFIISHDAMHGSLVPGARRINSAIGASLLFLYAGFSWRKMRDAHFDHHKLAGKAGDPDFDENDPTAFWPWYFTFLKRYFGLGSVLFIGTVVNVYWLVFDVPLAKIIVLYGLPAIASSVQLFYFGTFRPHHHNGSAFADRHNARSESFGTLASLASCFHFGYHHEHHCHPSTPWWGLPKIRQNILQKGDLA
ncbi:fatty acid desaturase [Pontixanthobacter sp.]|uniref:fatty acid desaturase n=1 Tax=Pontixanthobacter sp. TaxID=2792078 RepID=UPI003C7C6A25